jgi:hypothetical protein
MAGERTKENLIALYTKCDLIFCRARQSGDLVTAEKMMKEMNEIKAELDVKNQLRTMKLHEYFDPESDNHMSAWKHVCAEGTWPVGWLEQTGIVFEADPMWQYNIMSKLANAFCDLNLDGLNTNLDEIMDVHGEIDDYCDTLEDLGHDTQATDIRYSLGDLDNIVEEIRCKIS